MDQLQTDFEQVLRRSKEVHFRKYYQRRVVELEENARERAPAPSGPGDLSKNYLRLLGSQVTPLIPCFIDGNTHPAIPYKVKNS